MKTDPYHGAGYKEGCLIMKEYLQKYMQWNAEKLADRFYNDAYLITIE